MRFLRQRLHPQPNILVRQIRLEDGDNVETRAREVCKVVRISRLLLILQGDRLRDYCISIADSKI